MRTEFRATSGKSAVDLGRPGQSGIRARVRSSYINGSSGDTVNSTTYGAWKYICFTNWAAGRGRSTRKPPPACRRPAAPVPPQTEGPRWSQRGPSMCVSGEETVQLV
ncbi:hypothetical protein [Streptomyces sp. IBSBF 2435]|uniref:hypothetical protein n=1 Tax=Streptomyces sp. IBSBF 2435 TaxID=2903531 RepID=UPI002FDBA788